MMSNSFHEEFNVDFSGGFDITTIGESQASDPSNMRAPWIGKYVICRSLNEGVNAGKVLALDDTGVIIEDARRLHFHHPDDRSLSWYEGVAASGLGSDSRVSSPQLKLITEDYSLTLCSEQAEQSIRNYPTNQQS